MKKECLECIKDISGVSPDCFNCSIKKYKDVDVK
jgi:hypothetical protein